MKNGSPPNDLGQSDTHCWKVGMTVAYLGSRGGLTGLKHKEQETIIFWVVGKGGGNWINEAAEAQVSS